MYQRLKNHDSVSILCRSAVVVITKTVIVTQSRTMMMLTTINMCDDDDHGDGDGSHEDYNSSPAHPSKFATPTLPKTPKNPSLIALQ